VLFNAPGVDSIPHCPTMDVTMDIGLPALRAVWPDGSIPANL